MYGSMEESPAAAPALAPAELKAVRKLLSTTSSSIGGSDVTDQPGLLHEPQELSTSALAKLEAASDEVEFQQSIWDASLFLVRLLSMRRRARRRIQTSTLFATQCTVATRAACRRTNGTAHTRSGIKFAF